MAPEALPFRPPLPSDFIGARLRRWRRRFVQLEMPFIWCLSMPTRVDAPWKAISDRRSIRYCEAMHAVCEWPPARCIVISPRHETEAWMLADPFAVTGAFGYTGPPDSIGLPVNASDAERLENPKETLAAAMIQVRGRRRRPDIRQIIPAIAQRQSLDNLRRSRSFTSFEASLRVALGDLGCI